MKFITFSEVQLKQLDEMSKFYGYKPTMMVQIALSHYYMKVYATRAFGYGGISAPAKKKDEKSENQVFEVIKNLPMMSNEEINAFLRAVLFINPDLEKDGSTFYMGQNPADGVRYLIQELATEDRFKNYCYTIGELQIELKKFCTNMGTVYQIKK